MGGGRLRGLGGKLGVKMGHVKVAGFWRKNMVLVIFGGVFLAIFAKVSRGAGWGFWKIYAQ